MTTSYINRRQICALILKVVGTRWDHIDSVRRRKKRGRSRVKRRHATRLKWSIWPSISPSYVSEQDDELKRRLLLVAQRLGLKHFDRTDPQRWWGMIVIYVPNRMIKPRLPLTDNELRSYFSLLPDTPMPIVADKMEDEGFVAEAHIVRSQYLELT